MILLSNGIPLYLIHSSLPLAPPLGWSAQFSYEQWNRNTDRNVLILLLSLLSWSVSLSWQAKAIRHFYLQVLYCAISFFAAVGSGNLGKGPPSQEGATTLPYGLERKGTIALLSGCSHCSPHPFPVFHFFCFTLQLLAFSPPFLFPSAPACPGPMSWMGLLCYVPNLFFSPNIVR